MTISFNPQAKHQEPEAVGGLLMEKRIKYWSVEELALAKGLSIEDVSYFVNRGALPSSVSPVTSEVLLPANSDHLLDQLMFGECFEPKQKELLTTCHKLYNEAPPEIIDPASKIKEMLQSFSYGDKPKVLPSLKGLSIKASKKFKVLQLREHKNDKYFELISYPIDYQFGDEDIETLINAHKRFRSRIKSSMPWKDKCFLLNEGYREIRTFYELFEFHKEGQSKPHRQKISRIQERFFYGCWGRKLIANYCTTTFKSDYLDRPEPRRQPSDRNEIIKMVNAAISKAKRQLNIKIDCQELIAKGERSRADKTDKVTPKLSTLTLFITKAYQMGFDRLALSLIIQLMVSTRKRRTNHLSWERIKLDHSFVEVPCHENKTKFRRHPIPARLVEILKAEKLRQQKDDDISKDSNGEPLFVFESPFNKGNVLGTLDSQFGQVKASLIAQANEQGSSVSDMKAIRHFTQHRIRDLVEQQLKDVGATDGQKEKCLGRKPSEQQESYGALDIDTLSSIKDCMVVKIECDNPELSDVFKGLTRS